MTCCSDGGLRVPLGYQHSYPGRPRLEWHLVHQEAWGHGRGRGRGKKESTFLALFNELGADGWKLVATEAVDSVISEKWGWSEAATAVLQRWTFMREVDG